MVRVRFAPSPTGFIHVGNIRTALLNWLFAKSQGGEFILRIDDTDLERSTTEYKQALFQDMAWLGLHHDESFHQSDKLEHYQKIMEHLRSIGRLYPAYETSEELERKRKRQLAKGLPPVYDRAALKLTPQQQQEFEAQGRKPHWRFLLKQEIVGFDDLIHGRIELDMASVSDPVLIREDGSFLYTPCSVIDDIDSKITHIIRGDDHITNTGVQIQIFETLGHTPPQFGHHALLVGAEGEKLSKRTGSFSIADLREQGLEALTVCAYIARIGTSQPVEAVHNLQDLTQNFDTAHISKAKARFSVPDMINLNRQILAQMNFKDISARLESINCLCDENFWHNIRANINLLQDVKTWWQALNEPVILPIQTFSAEDIAFLQQAEQTFITLEWDEQIWKNAIDSLKQQTGRKGKNLFMPLRIALTGLEHGPEMSRLVYLLGQKQVSQRLQAATHI